MFGATWGLGFSKFRATQGLGFRRVFWISLWGYSRAFISCGHVGFTGHGIHLLMISLCHVEAVIETRLPEMDTFACTMALHRLARCSHDVDNHVQNGRMVRPEAVNPTRMSLSQREQRLWRASLSASVKQHPSFTVLLARLGNADALKQAWPDLHCFFVSCCERWSRVEDFPKLSNPYNLGRCEKPYKPKTKS